jgi:hypothetical protein
MFDPTQPPAAPPARRKRHIARWVLLAIATFVVLVTSIAVAAGHTTTPRGAATAAPATQASATTAPPVATPAAAPSTTPPSPTTVTFTVTGTGLPSITYGSDADNRDGGGHLGDLGQGNALPWSASVPFDGSAMYYDMSAQLQGYGDISCKITVTGPGLVPLVVAKGHASGSYNICSAQAAPADTSGTSWQSEG